MYLGRRAMPSVNPLISRRQYERSQDKHRRKLRTMKSSIDSGAPKSYKKGARRRNLKKEQMMEERCATEEKRGEEKTKRGGLLCECVCVAFLSLPFLSLMSCPSLPLLKVY